MTDTFEAFAAGHGITLTADPMDPPEWGWGASCWWNVNLHRGSDSMSLPFGQGLAFGRWDFRNTLIPKRGHPFHGYYRRKGKEEWSGPIKIAGFRDTHDYAMRPASRDCHPMGGGYVFLAEPPKVESVLECLHSDYAGFDPDPIEWMREFGMPEDPDALRAMMAGHEQTAKTVSQLPRFLAGCWDAFTELEP